MITRYGLILGGVMLASSAFATLGGTIPANLGAGTSYIGPTGDYATIKDAQNDFNALVGGLTGNYTLYVEAATLSEPANSWFGNLTNGFTLTIKPAPSFSPVVTFTQTPAQTGIFGNLVIGVNTGAVPTSAQTFSTNNGYVIDGSNTVGGTTRDMTFTCLAADPVGRLIRVWGDSDGVVVKNMKLISPKSSGTAEPIAWAAGAIAGAPTQSPDNGQIVNCEIRAQAAVTGYGPGFSTTANGTFPAATIAFNNMLVDGNDIYCRHRGINGSGISNITISNNRFYLVQTTTGYSSSAIIHISANTATGWTFNVLNNEFRQLATANASAGAYGIAALDLYSPGGTYNVKNNMLTGFNYTAAAPVDQLYRGINLGGNTSGYNVEHNSINMPPQAAVSGASAGRAMGIGYASTYTTGFANLKNNIIRFNGPGQAVYMAGATGFTPANQTGNNIVALGGAVHGRVGATSYADLAAWQGAGYDVTEGQSTDPTATSPGAWANATATDGSGDLRFTGGLPAPLQSVTPTITTDLDGNPRPATIAYPGAHESVSLPVEMSAFSID